MNAPSRAAPPISHRNICPSGWIGGIVGLLALGVMPLGALAKDPKVPPGPQTDGTAIALITTGIDYTRPAIAARLARDGEGELIGWDVVDDDRTPYAVSPNPAPAAQGGDGTALVERLIGLAPEGDPARLLPVRVDAADPVSLAKALAFLARTPARTVLVPMWGTDRAAWEPFAAAAAHFSQLRIVVPACADKPAGGPVAVYPRDLGLSNIVAPATGTSDEAPDNGGGAWAAHVAALPCLP